MAGNIYIYIYIYIYKNLDIFKKEVQNGISLKVFKLE